MADPQAGASMEDRVAALMDSPKPQTAEVKDPPAEVVAAEAPADNGEVAQTQEAPPFEFELLHNSTPVKITDPKELKDYAEKGYDYTRKTMTLAEERRAVEQERARVQQLANLQPQFVDAVAEAKAIERQLQAYERVDWVTYARDSPMEFPAQKAAFDQLKEGFQKAQQKAAFLFQQGQQLSQQQMRERLNSEYQKAVSAVPDWRNTEKFNQAREGMKAYMTEIGYQPHEINAVADHRMLLMARDAAAYRALQKSKSAAKVADISPTAKPGNAQTKQERQQASLEDLRRQARAEKDPRKQEKLVERLFAAKIK